MGIDGGFYRVILLLHILAVVAGFGPALWNGPYPRQAQYALYAVPVLGILLVLLSDETWGFDQLWITLSFVLYIAVLAAFLVIMRPAAERDDDKRAAVGSGIMNLSMLAILALMIWKPGL